jgi:hypothetical protein
MNTRIAIAAAVLLFAPCAAVAIPHASTPINTETSDKLIPMGTFIRIRMLDALSSSTTKQGTYFSWVVSDDIKIGTRVVIPVGTIGWGKVVTVSPAHGGRVPGFLRLRFYSISLTDGQRVDVAVTHASAVLDQNQKNGYGPAAEDVANIALPYFFLIDALRKGDDMVIPKNAVFHVAVVDDTFVSGNAMAVNATPPPSPTPVPIPAPSAAPGASGAPAASTGPAASAAPPAGSAASAAPSTAPAASAAPPATGAVAPAPSPTPSPK